MDNQHRKNKSYRELSEEEIALMNEAQELAEKSGALIEKLKAHPDTDKRSIAQGKANLQVGFMWAIRGVTRPETF